MQNWEQWIELNKPKLKHPADFEERFVREILTRIPEIEPIDVIAQYHFQDFNGGNRYIDFCIKNDNKGYFLSIELDGKDKFGYESLEATLERQNLIMAKKVGTLLRFANTTWLNKPDTVIQTIRIVLRDQHKAFVDENAKATLTAELEKQRGELAKLQNNDDVKRLSAIVNSLSTQLKEQVGNDNTQAIHRTLLGLAQQMGELAHHPIPVTTKPPIQIKNNTGLLVGSGFGLLGLGVAAFAYMQNPNSNPVQPAPTQEIVNPVYIEPKPQQLVIKPEIKTVVVEKEVIKFVPQQAIKPTPSPKQEVETVTSAPPEPINDTIQSANAYEYINTYQTVCGTVTQVKNMSGRTYINLGKPYPNQDIAIVVWSSDTDKVSEVFSYEGRSLCIKGQITTYQGSTQMKLSKLSQVVN